MEPQKLVLWVDVSSLEHQGAYVQVNPPLVFRDVPKLSSQPSYEAVSQDYPDITSFSLSSYGWWQPEIRETHQLRLVVDPIIYKVLYIPGGAGVLPSTVWLPKMLQSCLLEKVLLNWQNDQLSQWLFCFYWCWFGCGKWTSKHQAPLSRSRNDIDVALPPSHPQWNGYWVPGDLDLMGCYLPIIQGQKVG